MTGLCDLKSFPPSNDDVLDEDSDDEEAMPDQNPGQRLPENLVLGLQDLRVSVRNAPDFHTIKLSDSLEAFLQAVNYITATVCEAEDNKFSLADAAYALNNASSIWIKMVDETAVQCRLLEEISRNASDGKTAGADKEEGKKKTRRVHVHPLAVLMDDRKESAAGVLEPLKNSRRPDHKFMDTAIPALPQDQYLAEAQPASLGIMEHEKIRAYMDDRGNKGNDWAEFQLNTMKLNKEGYFAIEKLHPDAYHVVYPYGHPPTPAHPGLPPSDNGFPCGFSARESNGNVNPSIGFPTNTDMDYHNEEPNGGLPEADQYGGMPPPPPPPQLGRTRNEAPRSQGRPDRPNMILIHPYLKTLSISALKTDRNLAGICANPTNETNEFTPFRRRTRRIFQKTKLTHRNPETAFFQNFWIIPENSANIKCRLALIIRRFTTRLHRIEVPRKKRDRNAVDVTFVSQTSYRECPFGPLDVPALAFPASAEKEANNQHDGDCEHVANYIETNDPLGMDDDLFDAPEYLQRENEQFIDMVRQGKFLRNQSRDGFGRRNDDDDDSGVSDASKIVHIDLCDWERKLGNFLKVHEPSTATFKLEEFEREMVANCQQNFQNDKQALSLSSLVCRKTAGEVCRSFLSVLDLANKSVVKFPERNNDPQSQSSQGADRVMVHLSIHTSEIKRFCEKRSTETVPEETMDMSEE